MVKTVPFMGGGGGGVAPLSGFSSGGNLTMNPRLLYGFSRDKTSLP